MRSETTGKSTSPEITNISSHGLWVFWNEQEHFLDYDHFPWFKDATVSKLTNVVASASCALHWPDLDVDLSLDTILHPDRYPNVSK